MRSTLAIDTATLDTVAGVCGPDLEPLAELIESPAEDGRPRHAQALLRLLEDAVESAGGWSEIGQIAIGIGPGSFTGIRVGVTTARALAQAGGLALKPVRSSAALAAGIEAGEGRTALAVLDARRGEVFAEMGTGPGAASGAGPGAAERAPVLSAPDSLDTAIGGLADTLAAGEGALRFRPELEAAGAVVLPEGDPAHRISARHLCAVGAVSDPVAIEDVKPMYLRQPDAKRWHERD